MLSDQSHGNSAKFDWICWISFEIRTNKGDENTQRLVPYFNYYYMCHDFLYNYFLLEINQLNEKTKILNRKFIFHLKSTFSNVHLATLIFMLFFECFKYLFSNVLWVLQIFFSNVHLATSFFILFFECFKYFCISGLVSSSFAIGKLLRTASRSRQENTEQQLNFTILISSQSTKLNTVNNIHYPFN